MRVEIYVDVVCPWCYIGERRFARALAEYERATGGDDPVEAVVRSYQLDATAPRTAMPLREYLDARFGRGAEGMMEAVTSAGVDEGIRFDWDRALAVNTATAHRLLRLANVRQGAASQRALLERLFAAHFTHGEDVGDVETLAGHAAAVGMDADAVHAYLTSDEGHAELAAELDEARQLGVRAVPTFVLEGEFAVSGAQTSEVFGNVLQEVRRR
ncbi:MAG TPA: DsbA family oxidoreductase [Gemmatimonadaceae bacterium]|nr:DsbA family oxidoreductase [Gemmatimonadaceae bacterium]